MQHPLMKVIQGGSEGVVPVTGESVLAEIGALLEARLPLVPADDKLRSHLSDLHLLLAARGPSPRQMQRG